MRYWYLVLCFSLFLLVRPTPPAVGQTPSFLWATSCVRSTDLQGAGATLGTKVAVDAVGNTYVTGSFYGRAQFGAYSVVSVGANDVYVAKLDAAGNYLWAVAAGGTDEDQSLGITVDSQNNLYVTGSFRSNTATFGSFTVNNSIGTADVFVAKLTTAGTWQWAARGGGTGHDVAQGIATDGTSVFITGYSTGSQAIFGNSTLANASPPSAFVFAAKLTSSGTWLWAAGSSGPGGGQASGGQASAIAVDSQGNAYVVGDYGILATFGTTSLAATDFHDVFVAKLSATGTWLWAVRGGGSDDDYGLGIAVDGNDNPYLTGHSRSAPVTFGTTVLPNTYRSRLLFVVKLSSNGAISRVTAVEGAGGGVLGQALAVDAAGNAYVVGLLASSLATFGPLTLTSSGGIDAFVAKLTTAGTWQWALRGGSPTDDTCNGVGLDSQGNVSLAGTFVNPVQPAVFGAYTITSNPLSTTGWIARVGLPVTVQITGDSVLCASGQVQLLATPSTTATAYTWSTGATTASITVTQPGLYTVIVTFPGGLTRTATYRVRLLQPMVRIFGDTLLCPGTALTLTAAAPGATSLQWSTGSLSPTLSVTQPGSYSLTASYGQGCTVTVRVQVVPAAIHLVGVPYLCPGGNSSTQLTALAPGATGFRWNTGATTATLLVTQMGTYTVTATFLTGCTLSATQAVTAPRAIIRGDSSICTSTTVQLTAADASAAAYAWSTGATSATITVTQAGTYSVRLTYPGGCSSQAQHQVVLRPANTPFSIGADTTICEGDALFLRAPFFNDPTTSYRWSDGSTLATLRVQQPGLYSLERRASCGIQTASRQVMVKSCVFIPNVITPNGDGQNDRFTIMGLAGDCSLTIYNRWGRQLYATQVYHNTWGEEANPGVYYYFLRHLATQQVYKGWVEVVR
jgi:gliding motility-associated-like protein